MNSGIPFKTIYSPKGTHAAILVTVTIMLLLSVFQDLLQANFNNYAFYLSESMLFNSFWLLFIPMVYLNIKILGTEKLKTFKYLPLQLFLASVILHMLLFSVIVWLLSELFFDHTYALLQNFYYTLSESGYILLLIYGALILFLKYAAPKLSLILPPPVKKPEVLSKITISNGRKYVNIDVMDIICIKALTPYIAICLENNQYLHSETLKSVSEKLDQDKFIRVHKSTIINIDKMVSYRSRLNGDYDIAMEDGTMVRLSRTYFTKFKRGLMFCSQDRAKSHQVNR
ncbi:LytTR family DNA-binding domain-containing protein [Pedobacter sp.]|uniref:LytR/AlgR family response regulator transcription factor n=1 Tax=Pedobacter sp. TaxID=1411316 RepID=UPI0031DBBD25